jgi:hypothetical protein
MRGGGIDGLAPARIRKVYLPLPQHSQSFPEPQGHAASGLGLFAIDESNPPHQNAPTRLALASDMPRFHLLKSYDCNLVECPVHQGMYVRKAGTV